MRSPPVVSLALLTIVANGAPAPATNFLSGTELGAVGQSPSSPYSESAPEAPIALWTFSDSSKRSYLQPSDSLQKRSTPDPPPASDPHPNPGPGPGGETKSIHKVALEKGDKILAEYQTHLSEASKIKPAEEAVTRHKTGMTAAADAFILQLKNNNPNQEALHAHREAFGVAFWKHEAASVHLTEVKKGVSQGREKIAQRAHELVTSPEYKGKKVPWQPELVDLASEHAPIPNEFRLRTLKFL